MEQYVKTSRTFLLSSPQLVDNENYVLRPSEANRDDTRSKVYLFKKGIRPEYDLPMHFDIKGGEVRRYGRVQVVMPARELDMVYMKLYADLTSDYVSRKWVSKVAGVEATIKENQGICYVWLMTNEKSIRDMVICDMGTYGSVKYVEHEQPPVNPNKELLCIVYESVMGGMITMGMKHTREWDEMHYAFVRLFKCLRVRRPDLAKIQEIPLVGKAYDNTTRFVRCFEKNMGLLYDMMRCCANRLYARNRLYAAAYPDIIDAAVGHVMDRTRRSYEIAAGEVICMARNWGSMWLDKLNNGDRPMDEIDLHGYSQHDAVKLVRSKLDTLRERGVHILYVITGRGAHSGMAGPVVKNAVLRTLNEEGLSYAEVFRNPGCLKVDILGTARLETNPATLGHTATQSRNNAWPNASGRSDAGSWRRMEPHSNAWPNASGRSDAGSWRRREE